jgi:hypothetical protein
MPSTDQYILKTFRELRPHSFIHTEGFTCFPQITVEFHGIDPESAENWVLANGGHLKHVKIPPHVDRLDERRMTQPDMEPCYFVPDAVLS